MARSGFNVIAAASAANGASATRDRRRLAVLFLLPTVITAVIGVAMGGYADSSLVVGILNRAGTIESATLVAAITAEEHTRIRNYTDQERMRIAVFRGRLNAGVIIPPGWHGTDNLQVYLSRASVGSPILQSEIDAELSRMARGGKPLTIATRFPGGGRASAPRIGLQYTAPANLVLFLMINGFVASLGIIQLRRTGLSQRLLATPRRTWELFAMLAVGPMQQMIAQAIFLILSARLAFGVHWGDPLGVLLVTTALICFGTSLVLLMGTVFRTPEQPTSLGPWIGVVVGMLGGCMWPLEVVPPFMRTVAYFSPAAWAMDAYLALIFNHATAREVAPDAAVLFLVAAALATLGIIRLRPEFSR
jgi:ABC-2 type transport system permease protein